MVENIFFYNSVTQLAVPIIYPDLILIQQYFTGMWFNLIKLFLKQSKKLEQVLFQSYENIGKFKYSTLLRNNDEISIFKTT